MISQLFTILLSSLLSFSSLCSVEFDSSSPYGESALLPEIFVKRHSGTNFDSTPVSEEQVQALIQAARWSPSSYNDQPWNFIFCDKYNNPENYLKIIDSIYGQEWVEDAPLLVVALARSHFLYNGKFNDWAEYDTGAAALGMSLAATELGLMAHQIGGFDPEQLQEDFNIPEGFTPLAVIAIGYESQPVAKTPRVRRPVEENFFDGAWGKSFNN